MPEKSSYRLLFNNGIGTRLGHQSMAGHRTKTRCVINFNLLL